MIPEARVVEIERRLEGLGLANDRLDSRLAAVEQLASQLSSGMGGGFGGGAKRGRIALATTAIGASDATTPGGGTVQPMRLASGDYEDVCDPIAVYNAGGPISSGKRCSYWYDAEGVAWVEPEECEDVEEEEE